MARKLLFQIFQQEQRGRGDMIKFQSKMMAVGLVAASILFSSQAMAGAKLEVDETKWISIGIGVRSSFTSVEDAAPDDGRSEDFNLDNARIYINGQIHKYIKFEFNTECFFCDSSTLRNFDVLDAIGKFEFNPAFNIWAGRLLVPPDRAEISGPFYPSDFSVTYGVGGAGVYGRDEGVNLWGASPHKENYSMCSVFSMVWSQVQLRVQTKMIASFMVPGSHITS